MRLEIRNPLDNYSWFEGWAFMLQRRVVDDPSVVVSDVGVDTGDALTATVLWPEGHNTDLKIILVGLGLVVPNGKLEEPCNEQCWK